MADAFLLCTINGWLLSMSYFCFMRCIHFSFFIFSFLTASAQFRYQRNYFRYPLNIPQKLNANFGEMRPNHYHMGLDLNTMAKENFPVLAAADGYIARVKIEAGGFGNAVYINHPNGLTTLYAHLNSFMPKLAAYVEQQQYKQENWKIELEIPANLFPVKKGEQVALSGNTGGSQGPHVHFEIRETVTDKCLNPQLFDFGIPDTRPPDIYKIAVYDANKSLYEQTPQLLAVKKMAAGNYSLTGLVKVSTDKILLAVQAVDRNDLSANPNGFYDAVLYKNNEIVSGFTLNNISYDDTRFCNAHIDYRTKYNGGPYLQLLNELPGNTADIYKELPGKYFVSINDYDVKEFRLELKDAGGNLSRLNFRLQSDHVDAGMAASGKNRVTANVVNIQDGPGLQLYFPENCFYDAFDFKMTSVAATLPGAYSPVYNFQTAAIPVHDTFYLRIKPDKIIPENLKDRMIIQKTVKRKTTVEKTRWERDYLGAAFREFGEFVLLADDIPPQIISYGLKDGMNISGMKKISITIKDNNEEIKNFRAELDGKWLLFSQRGNTFTYRVDDHFPAGEHQLKIAVQDEAGNTSEIVYKLIK
jgi:murein DD-endopeptidase MepM/ murein hydrolase activator NlpD